ncbi:MAG TPA: hypothetical protein VN580_01825 [Clostridia bacterium]|nr:hypothetical protein [Clostridia bacterium]
MRRYPKAVIAVVAVFSLSVALFANSGPVFWPGYPSSEVMSVAGNCPIRVEGENLTFDFSGIETTGYSVDGRVTAAYEMVNPTAEQQSVQMAFPFVGTLARLPSEDIAVTADGRALPYVVYPGTVVDGYGNPTVETKEISLNFADIVGGITNVPYEAANFKENETGRLYKLNIEPAGDKDINFAVDFTFDNNRTKIITKNFDRYERDGEKTRIAAWCHEPKQFEIYVIGEAIDFGTDAYLDGELAEKTDLYTCKVTTEEIELKTYLMSYAGMDTSLKNGGRLSVLALYNLYAGILDRCFELNSGYSSDYDLMDQRNYERLLTLVYTVEFPPEGKKEVSVRYNASGTMDRRETSEPIYSYDYILNPAQNWGGFKNLSVRIIPPEQAPYIVRSSIDLVREESGVYTAFLESLPEEDFSFALYEKGEITFLDRVAGSLYSSFGYLYPVVVGFVILLAAIFAAVYVRRRRKL